MVRTLTFILVAVLVVSTAGIATGDTIGRPELSVHLPDNRVEVGEETTLDLYVLNGGVIHQGGTQAAESRVTTAREVLLTVRDRRAPLTVETGPQPVGNVPEGVVGPVTFAVTVDQDVSPGSYELPVQLSYVYTREIDTEDPEEPEHFQRSATLDTTVTLEVEASADFDLSDVTSTLAVGDEGTFEGTITNTGQAPVRNAVVVLADENVNIVPLETEHAIGDLDPGESATFAFDAEVSDSANAGPRQLSVSVRYRDTDDEIRQSDPLDANVEVGPRPDVFLIEPVRSGIQAGQSGELELRITNARDEPVSDISAKLFTDGPLSSSDDEAFIDELEPGDSDTILFELSAAPSALGKRYPVSLDFQYDDADGDTKLSDTYDVPVQVREPVQDDRPSNRVIGAVVVVALVLVVIGLWLWRRR